MTHSRMGFFGFHHAPQNFCLPLRNTCRKVGMKLKGNKGILRNTLFSGPDEKWRLPGGRGKAGNRPATQPLFHRSIVPTQKGTLIKSRNAPDRKCREGPGVFHFFHIGRILGGLARRARTPP